MSNDFCIIPDSSCDLNAELRERFGIPDYLHGTVVFPDGRDQPSCLDWTTISPAEYYASMRDKKHLIKTATPSIGATVEVFSKYAAMGYDILNITLSSGLSGTLNVCRQAAKKVLEQFPDRKIICLDSLKYSTSIGLLIIKAAELKKEGKTIDEVAAYLDEMKYHIHQIGSMDDLYFLCNTGRISNFKAFFGTLVGVSPMADINREGMSEVLVKCKGKAMTFAVAIDYIKETIESPSEQIIFIAHSNRREYALRFKELIAESIKPRDIIINDIGMACGASIGPGLVAAFYYGKETTEGLVTEKALARQLIEKHKTVK